MFSMLTEGLDVPQLENCGSFMVHQIEWSHLALKISLWIEKSSLVATVGDSKKPNPAILTESFTNPSFRGHYITNPKNALFIREIPQIHNTFVLFDPSQKGNLMIPVFLQEGRCPIADSGAQTWPYPLKTNGWRDTQNDGPWKRWLRLQIWPIFGIYMGVSKNNGTPKSSILIGFSIINHPFWGTSIFGIYNMLNFWWVPLHSPPHFVCFGNRQLPWLWYLYFAQNTWPMAVPNIPTPPALTYPPPQVMV